MQNKKITIALIILALVGIITAGYSISRFVMNESSTDNIEQDKGDSENVENIPFDTNDNLDQSIELLNSVENL